MNKFLLIIILLVLVINLTIQMINAMSSNDRRISNSHHNGIKRIKLQQFKRNCTNVDDKHYCRGGTNNSTRKMIKRKRSSGATQSTDLIKDEDSGLYWMGLVTIGTPGQSFYVDFDTGSSDLWVEGVQCGESCTGSNKFNSSASSTYQFWNNSFYISYEDNSSVNGTWANDTVTIAGISIENQPFAVADSAQGMPNITRDGILGMGYPQIASAGENPVVWSMYLAGKLQQPVFCFWFDAISTGNNQGELILGGYDTTKYIGSITYTQVSSQGYWEFIADNITATIGSSTTLIASSFNAVLDTGTTNIIGPVASVNQINSILNAQFDSSIGWYTVDCQKKSLSEFPNITITINGTPFTLTPLMYIQVAPISISGQYVCYSIISSSDAYDFNGQLMWTLGDYFMRRFYSVFDMQNNQIGLALSISYSAIPDLPSGIFPSKTTSIMTKQTITIPFITFLMLFLYLF